MTNFPGTGGVVLDPAGVPINATSTFHFIDPYGNSGIDLVFAGGKKWFDDPNTWEWTTNKASAKTDINNVLLHLTPDGKMPGESRSSPREILNYLGRISGLLLDRIDLRVEVGEPGHDPPGRELCGSVTMNSKPARTAQELFARRFGTGRLRHRMGAQIRLVFRRFAGTAVGSSAAPPPSAWIGKSLRHHSVPVPDCANLSPVV